VISTFFKGPQKIIIIAEKWKYITAVELELTVGEESRILLN
jgi:hypothetical protein